MSISKRLIAVAVILVAGWSLLRSQETPAKKADPPTEVKAAPREAKQTEKQRARLDELRKKKITMAKGYFDAQFELCRLNLQDVLAVKEAALILGRAKYDVSTSDDERLTILIDQKKIFDSVVEMVAKRVDRGTAAKLDLTQVKMGQLDAEIELEEFKLRRDEEAAIRK